MKKPKILIISFLLIFSLIQAQENIIGEKSISNHYKSDNLSSDMIIARAEKWFSDGDNSGQFEILGLDQNKGEIVVEGTTKVLYKNLGKDLYPKRSGMAEVLEANFGNKIRIQTEKGGYTITYEVTDMKKEMYKKEDLFFNCVNFKNIDRDKLNEYNKAMNKLLKANLVFKKRREIFIENSESQFKEVSSYLMNDGEVTIYSINEAITSGI